MNVQVPGGLREPLQTLFGAGALGGLTDGQLLDRFAGPRDRDADAAFAALVSRHGPTVRRVCRSLLSDPNDADDAFQATFLVLARKAGVIRRPDLLGSWLYGTAHRAARTLKTRAARRLKHEAREAAMARAGASTDPGDLEQHAARREETRIVHEELARLPAAGRTAVVLCDLEGRTQQEASRLLRCSDRTLRRRLERTRRLLRLRLVRRGLCPTAGLFAAALEPEPASAAIPQMLVDSTARTASRFAAASATTGSVPAPSWALAKRMISGMVWAKLKIAIASASVFVAGLGVAAGTGVGPRPAAGDLEKQAESRPASQAGSQSHLPSPAEQYRNLLQSFDRASEAFSKIGTNSMTPAEREAAYKGHHIPQEDFNPQFLALAERYPKHPVAPQALLWILANTMSYWDGYNRAPGDPIDRAMQILTRDHLADPRLGALCLKLTYYPSPRRDQFLRDVAARATNRVVRGRATMALAQYLKNKGQFVESLKQPGPEQEEKVLFGIYGSQYLPQLRAADPAPMLREADQLFARVIAEFGDVAYAPPSDQPSRETLADVAQRDRQRGPATGSQLNGLDEPTAQFQTIDAAFRAGVMAANQAAEKSQSGAGRTQPAEPDFRAYVAAYPRWPDAGLKMWRLAQAYPRHQAAFDALIWLVQEGPRFFDSRKERDAVMFQVVHTLENHHLASIAEHLADRNVAMALNIGEPLPAVYHERLLRALFQRGGDRATRGRMGLALGRYLAIEAEFVERLTRAGSDSQQPWELGILEPAVADQLRKADHQAITRQAEEVLERVIAEYGDVVNLNGQVASTETVAAVAERALFQIRSLAVGCVAPEITGEDAFGKPMKLSEFRGKVVLLDFGSHEHCSGCKVLYPRLRATLARLRDRPFVILGVNNFDRRGHLKEAFTHDEITWRCWWDGDDLQAPGPITTRWNIRAYPTFILIDRRGVIRARNDIHPFNPSFDRSIDALLKEAQRDQ
jgi:RNA polymerase sigma factor (sigma-70 family)